MKPQPGAFAFWIAFLALCLLITELHEQAHIQTGYLLFGAYGPRDFKLWQVAGTGPRALLATGAGPLFSYLVAWMGVLLLRRQLPSARAWGFALVFASLPFAHIFTSFMGSGDEQALLKTLFPAAGMAGRYLVAAWDLLVYGVPVVLALRALPQGRRGLILAALLVLPMILEFGLLHRFYNGLLHGGWGAATLFGGTPLLVQAHLLSLLILLWGMRGAIIRRSPVLHSQPELLPSFSF
jgi:hypothetical protein